MSMDDNLRRAYAGPDFPNAQRSYLVVPSDGTPHEMPEQREVVKHGQEVPMSGELLIAPLVPRLPEVDVVLRRAEDMTPAEREQWHRDREERRQAMKAERAAVRATTTEVPFSAEAVEERLGLATGMLAHMSQPYCTCSMGYDGIEYCEHAQDLGLTC